MIARAYVQPLEIVKPLSICAEGEAPLLCTPPNAQPEYARYERNGVIAAEWKHILTVLADKCDSSYAGRWSEAEEVLFKKFIASDAEFAQMVLDLEQHDAILARNLANADEALQEEARRLQTSRDAWIIQAK